MKDFEEFLRANKDKLYALAEKNTPRNANGDAVISRDDPWFYEDEWDDYYKELTARDDSATRSVVC